MVGLLAVELGERATAVVHGLTSARVRVEPVALFCLAVAGLIQTVALSRPILAVLAILGIWWLEPLPDKDQRVEWLEHRKTSHSLVAVGLSGAVFGAIGWLVGRYAVEPIVGALFTTSASAGGSGLSWWAARLVALDASTLGAAGMWIGAAAIVVHLLGDVITKGGLQPLLPFSRWKLRFSPLSYDNRIAKNGLFAFGALAVIASLASVVGLLA